MLEGLDDMLAVECSRLSMRLDSDFCVEEVKRLVGISKLREMAMTGELRRRTAFTDISMGLFLALYPVCEKLRWAVKNQHARLLGTPPSEKENGQIRGESNVLEARE